MGMLEILKVLGVVCLLTGCASTNSAYKNGEYKAPYIQGTTTIQ